MSRLGGSAGGFLCGSSEPLVRTNLTKVAASRHGEKWRGVARGEVSKARDYPTPKHTHGHLNGHMARG